MTAAAKPTGADSSNATWAESGSTIEPSSGKKASGWVASEEPPASWLNWTTRAIFRWLRYLRDFEGNAHAWVAAHTFSALTKFNNRVDFYGATGDDEEATRYPAEGTYRKLEIEFGAGTALSSRFYLVADGSPSGRSFEHTHNLRWNNSTHKWQPDNHAVASSMQRRHHQGGCWEYYHASGGTSWNDEDASWDAITALGDRIDFSKVWDHATSGGYPDPDVGLTNVLCPSGLLKARATIRYDHSETTFYLDDGMNIKSPIAEGTALGIGLDIQFQDPMADADYQVVFGQDTGLYDSTSGGSLWIPMVEPTVIGKRAEGFGLYYVKGSGAAAGYTPGRDHVISVLIFGKQVP